MFTIKFYSESEGRLLIMSARSFMILRNPPGPDDGGEAEITVHQKDQAEDRRIDIKRGPNPDDWPPVFARATIENEAGKTIEVVGLRPVLGLKAVA